MLQRVLQEGGRDYYQQSGRDYYQQEPSTSSSSPSILQSLPLHMVCLSFCFFFLCLFVWTEISFLFNGCALFCFLYIYLKVVNVEFCN